MWRHSAGFFRFAAAFRRPTAAFFATAFRSSAVNEAKPFFVPVTDPPLLPISARYLLIALFEAIR
jgi:hypothetical protein